MTKGIEGMRKMKALVLESAGCLAMKECPAPVPRDGEVLIRTAAAAICTSDLYDIRFNPFGIRLPMIMGHEGAGVVEALGGDVDGFSKGDGVAAHSVISCMKCASCRRGLTHLCDDMEHLGLNHGGVFAEYFTMRADRVRKKPEGIDFAAAALFEPVCVCVESIKRSNSAAATNILIIGDGPFGIMTANILSDMFPDKKLIISGTNDEKLKYAKTSARINISRIGAGAPIKKAVLEHTNGEGVDSAILCAGTAEALDAAVDACRSRGTICVFSAIHGKAPVDLFKVHVKELNICGSCNDLDCLDEALAILGKPETASVITHTLPFEEYEAAFEIASDKSSGALKVCMTF